MQCECKIIDCRPYITTVRRIARLRWGIFRNNRLIKWLSRKEKDFYNKEFRKTYVELFIKGYDNNIH